MNYQRAMRCYWPRWAREAWAAGYIMQKPIRAAIAHSTAAITKDTP
jgi:hypothetical protein